MNDFCARFNKERNNYILQLDKSRRIFCLTFSFKKPMKDFSYNYKAICPYQMNKIIQTFTTQDIEVLHFLFIFFK